MYLFFWQGLWCDLKVQSHDLQLQLCDATGLPPSRVHVLCSEGDESYDFLATSCLWKEQKYITQFQTEWPLIEHLLRNTDEPIVLLGHSMGGGAASQIAERIEHQFPPLVCERVWLGTFGTVYIPKNLRYIHTRHFFYEHDFVMVCEQDHWDDSKDIVMLPDNAVLGWWDEVWPFASQTRRAMHGEYLHHIPELFGLLMEA